MNNASRHIATTADLGEVIVGDNVTVDLSGKISVPEATTSRYGVVKFPEGDIGVLGISNGQLVNNTSSYNSSMTSENEFTIQTVFDVIYPVGSIYVSVSRSGNAPFPYGSWELVDPECTLWSTALTALP